MERLLHYFRLSERIPGWTRGEEAHALAHYAFTAPADAVVVEIGAFLGSGTILLAGARKLRRTGSVHSIDPFDGSGDDFSVPHYQAILNVEGVPPQRQRFEQNLIDAGLQRWARAYTGRAEEVAVDWNTPIDLLYIDGDQSPAGVQRAYAAWQPWLKVGAIIALHNSDEREYAASHDGHYRLRQAFGAGTDVRFLEQAGSTTLWQTRPH